MNDERTIVVTKLASDRLICELRDGDLMAALSTGRAGINLHGRHPSDPNEYFTCPKLTINDLKAMIEALENYGK